MSSLVHIDIIKAEQNPYPAPSSLSIVKEIDTQTYLQAHR